MEFEAKLPILGFENITSYTLTKIDDTFMKLEAEDGKPTFTLINPYFFKEYSFEIPQVIKTLLEIEDDSALLIFDIVIIQNPIESSTINFIAPLIFNTSNKTFAQAILDSNRYPNYGLSEPISDFLKKEES